MKTQELPAPAALKLVLEQVPVIIWTTDADLRITAMSGPGVRELGTRDWDWLGTSLRELSPRHPSGALMVEAHEAALAGHTGTGEMAMGNITLKFRVEPLRDEAGRIVGTLAVGRNVALQRHTEAALQESERRFRRVLENINLIALVLDPDGKATFANDHLLDLLGMRRDEVLNHDWFATGLPPEEGRRVSEIFRQSAATGSFPVHFENEIVTRSGARRLVSWTNTALRDAAGRVTGYASIGDDITESRNLEARLRENLENFQAVADNAHDGILIGDAEHHAYANSRACAITGYSNAELLGMGFAKLADPAEVPKLAERQRRRLAGESVPNNYETFVRHKTGRRIEVDVTATRTVWQGRPLSLVILRDITERRQVERRAQQLTEALKQINDLAVAVADLPADRDIYELLAGQLRTLTQAVAVGLTEYDPERGELRVRRIAVEPDTLARVNRALGVDVLELRMPLEPEMVELLGATRLGELGNLHQMTFRAIPPDAAAAVEQILGAERLQGMAFVDKNELVGTALIFLPPGVEAPDRALLEAFAPIATIALRRRRAEARLRVSEQRFQDLLVNVKLLAVVVDKQGDITFINDFLLELTGWQRTEVLGRNWFEMFLPEDEGRKVRRVYDSTIETGTVPLHLENEIRTRSGARRLIAWNNTALRDAAGVPVGLAALGEDVTERRAAERRMAHVNAVLRAMRQVNRVTARQSNRSRLLKDACTKLVETGSYDSAWMALLEPDRIDAPAGTVAPDALSPSPRPGTDPARLRLAAIAEAGLGPEFRALHRKLKQGDLTHCVRRVMEAHRRSVERRPDAEPAPAEADAAAPFLPEPVVVTDPERECAGCPEQDTYPGRFSLSVALAYAHEFYGVLTVSLPPGLPADAEEIALLAELAGDIGHTLHARRVEEERRNVEAALRLTQFSLDRASLASLWIAADGRLLRVNRAACASLGYTEAELQQMTVFDIDPDMTPENRAALWQTMKDRQTMTIETRHRRKDGTAFPVEVTLNCLEYEGATYDFAFARDISEQKRNETALRKSEEKYRFLFEQAPVGVIIADPDGRITDANRAAQDMLGYAPGALAGCSLSEFYVDRDESKLLQTALGSKRRLHNWEVVLRRRDDRQFMALLNIERTEVEERPVLFLTLRDITERKEAERALQRYSERLEILHEIDQAIVAARSPSEVAQAALGHCRKVLPGQRASITLFDYPVDEFEVLALRVDGTTRLGLNSRGALSTFPVASLREGKTALFDDLAQMPEPSPVYRQLLDEGMRSVMNVPLLAQEELVGTLNLAARQPGAFRPEHEEIAREIAVELAIAIQQARLRAELERHATGLEYRVKERTAQLEAMNRELESFCYSVSHDLRAPLRSLDGFSQALLEDMAESLGPQGQDYLKRVRVASQRMSQLIDDLLQLSRVARSELHRERVSLTILAQGVISDLRETAPDRAAEIFIAPGMTAWGDNRLLRLVLVNLLGNAWKFSSKRARTVIEFNRTEADGESVFSVRDNGAGFDMHNADKLFAPFQRCHAPEEFPGTGIGLATVQRIIRRHGGRVWAESEPGKGAAFFFTLPDREPERDG